LNGLTISARISILRLSKIAALFAIERSSEIKCGPYSHMNLPNWPGVVDNAY